MTLGPDGRYQVRKLLGDGTFGRVLACAEVPSREIVAVKVVKSVRRYRVHAKVEADILREIFRCDPGRQSHCVELRETFTHHPGHHFCFVFERLDASLRDFLKYDGCKGLLANDVLSVAHQLLQCLSFLHAIGLAHTDLKCRNVMLRDARFDVVPLPRSRGAEARRPRCCDVVVIDFGGACFRGDRHAGCVGTRPFRSPEVLLGLPWDEATDLWSAGCLVAMCYLGARPFTASEDFEHLALMEKVLGSALPKPMLREAAKSRSLPQGVSLAGGGQRLDWPARAGEEAAVQRVQRAQRLGDAVRPQHAPLLRLMEALLQLDPKSRALAASAAKLLPQPGAPALVE